MWTRIRLAIVLTVLGVGQAFAQGSAYPNKPLRWLVPFAPAGGTDLVARPIAQRLSDRLGQSILIDNRGGGGGVIAAEIVARAVPDGYTLLVGAVAVMTVNVSLMKMPFDPVRDFAPITKFAAVPNMLAVRAALPARTLQELVEYAKGNPRKVTWAMSGIGSPGSLGGELFARQANISVVQRHLQRRRSCGAFAARQRVRRAAREPQRVHAAPEGGPGARAGGGKLEAPHGASRYADLQRVGVRRIRIGRLVRSPRTRAYAGRRDQLPARRDGEGTRTSPISSPTSRSTGPTSSAIRRSSSARRFATRSANGRG